MAPTPNPIESVAVTTVSSTQLDAVVTLKKDASQNPQIETDIYEYGSHLDHAAGSPNYSWKNLQPGKDYEIDFAVNCEDFTAFGYTWPESKFSYSESFAPRWRGLTEMSAFQKNLQPQSSKNQPSQTAFWR